MKIIIIDDDKLTTTSLKHSVEKLGHKAVVAENGEEAITKITEGDFDMIICDIMLPGISGLSLVTVLRTVKLIFTPIVMMSTIHNRHLIDAAIEAGANGFLDKPIVTKELEEKLRVYEKVS
jgi:CheY-like chemotaxis protein